MLAVMGDFNADGYDDLVVGSPYEDIGSKANAGSAHVFYGSSSGISTVNDRILHQDVSGVTGTAEQDDYFGAAVAIGDFNGDGYDDLAVGAPGESINNIANVGAVHIFYGSYSGITTTGDRWFHQNSSGVGSSIEEGDQFGKSLAVGDFDGDGYDDLAVGAPGEDLGSASSAGAVNVLYGSYSGLTGSGSTWLNQNVSGIAETAESYDNFGSSLTAGDFNGDNRDDLAIGAPGESIGTTSYAGGVHVVYGASSGITTSGDQFFSQNTSGVSDTAQSFDFFGSRLTSGDFNNDGRDDLVIGVPEEDIGSLVDAGVVHVLKGSSSGVTTSGQRYLHQNASGVNGIADSYEYFGMSLATGDFDNDGRDDLAVGAPGEDIGSAASAGVLHVFFGASTGITTSGDQYLHQNTSGILGTANANDEFARTLAAGDYNNDGRADLAVGVPREKIGTYSEAGAVQILDGSSSGISTLSDQFLHEDTSGVAGAARTGDRFGDSLA